MNQTVQPTAMPMMPPAPLIPMAGMPTQPQADVISPNEAKFWQQQANRAPALLREDAKHTFDAMRGGFAGYKIAGVGVGAALGALTFTEHVRGKWKIATVLGAAASLMVGGLMHSLNRETDTLEVMVASFATALESSPEGRESLAKRLQETISAEDIQKLGLDKAVATRTHDVMMEALNKGTGRHTAKLGQSNAQISVPSR